MTLTYQDIHWGLSPTQTLEMKVWPYGQSKVATIGRCARISYRSEKGGEWRTFEHAFETNPLVLVPSSTGETLPEARPVPDDMIAVGWLVDLVMDDDRRIVIPGYIVATDTAGSSIWLAATGGQPLVALEQKTHGPIVTPRGIEK